MVSSADFCDVRQDWSGTLKKGPTVLGELSVHHGLSFPTGGAAGSGRPLSAVLRQPAGEAVGSVCGGFSPLPRALWCRGASVSPSFSMILSVVSCP